MVRNHPLSLLASFTTPECSFVIHIQHCNLCERLHWRALWIGLLLELHIFSDETMMYIHVLKRGIRMRFNYTMRWKWELTSINLVTVMSSMYDSASSSTFVVFKFSPPRPADFFSTAVNDGLFSTRNFRPCSRVCSFCEPRLKTAAQMILMIAESKSQCLFTASESSISRSSAYKRR